MGSRKVLISAVSVLSLGGARAYAAMHATPEFESGKTRPVSIAFLPPHVDVIKRKIVKSEQEVQESVDFAPYLAASLKKEFAAQGYQVTVLSAEQVNADPALQELVVDADRRYTELLKEVQVKLPRQIGKRRYQAGDEMRLLAAKLGVDAIGFADMQIVAAAKGASAVALLTGIGAAGSATMLSISVIDGTSANIEAYFVPPALRRGSMAGYDAIMADPEGKIGQITELSLRDLPAADPSARAVKPASGQDKDVVSDVESLLKKP
jgi:hypothetical protein